ncbi:uncharacterized protein G2W53_022011 [Senna tora]|uniref:Uncharacterized protein n=1 Tax=Senna tora TaxID=362788 RepID=A0A834WID7_9FABA|nr:uncharacterized protein G2W53_022011 [Senna tora]
MRAGVDLMPQLESSWHGRSMDHVLTYFRRHIAVVSQKPSRITRQKTCCANEKSRLDLRNLHELQGKRLVTHSDLRNLHDLRGKRLVAQAWDERGSCPNIFWTTNRGRISEIFKKYVAKDLLCNEGNTSVRVAYANRSGFDAPIGVVMPWEERGSCINIFWTINRDRILETFTNYEAEDFLRKNLNELQSKRLVAQVSETRAFVLHMQTGVDLMLELESSCHGKSVDDVLTYFGRQIASGFDAPIGVVILWEERGSCLNIFGAINRGQISETLTNYYAKGFLRKNLHELRGKRLVAQVIETRRFALHMRTEVDLMLQLESSRHGRSMDRVLTYSGR